MAVTLPKIQSRPDFVDEVYQMLLDAISDGTLAPGTRLTQEEIAEQMQVSRSPVIQALRILKKDGFVQDAPGRGVLVTPLDGTLVGHLYEIRGSLDALAARLAAERKFQVDPDIIVRGRKSARGKDVKAMIDVDMEFHQAIYRAAGNPLLEQSAQIYWVHLRRVMGAVLQSSMQQREAIWDEHEAIAQAIAAGDSVSAVELTDLHTHRARANLVSRLDEYLGEASPVV
ncbi:GntR family transcriptional regulator [Bordetella muralis]|jgi:DNA-binding GntR family transcriptional regulator|uniref:GntR family transcriptional regulator n=1 Tax=Bordetella muralis TaxID=1649130 RepID=UPI0039F01DE3